MKDLFNREIELPKIGDKVLIDGYEFTVTDVRQNKDLAIIASIDLRGESGVIEVGYYDYINHERVKK